MKRIGITVLVTVVVLGIAAVVWLGRSLDGLVEQGIETYGSAALGTQVEVGAVELELRAGRGIIRGLRVSNPQGFSSEEKALTFEELTVGIVPESVVGGGPIRLTQVRLLDPHVRLEVDAQGRSNLQVLQRNAAAYAPPDDEPRNEGGEPLRLRIDALEMQEGRVQADLREIGDAVRDARLRSFTLTDLGGADGLAPAELAQQVAVRLTRQVADAVARERIGAAVEKELDERLGDRPASGAAKELLRSLGRGSDAN